MRLSCSSSRSRLRPFAVSTNARSALCIARSSVASCALATVPVISSRNESSSEVRVASTLRKVESKRLRWSVNASLVSTARSRVRDSSVPNRATSASQRLVRGFQALDELARLAVLAIQRIHALLIRVLVR